MSQRFSTHAPGLPGAPYWLTVVFPALLYPLMAASAFVFPNFYDFWQRKEGGIEFATVLFLLVGVVYGALLVMRYRNKLPRKWLIYWFAFSTFGMIVFAGEELSWGQHLGFWGSEDIPLALRMINDQDESNFHNTYNLLDQGLKNLIVAGTFGAFFLLPIYQRYRRKTMGIENPGYWFWPTRAGLVTAIGVIMIPFPKRIYEWVTGLDGHSKLRHSEFHEFYIALLMTIYMIDAYNRARAAPRAR